MLRKINNNVLRLKKNNEKIPNVLRRFYDKPKDYQGGISLTADPGLIIPRVTRDAKVTCPCLWASETYLDDNGRSRIDAAFGIAVGTIDGIIRIEAGEELIPIYNYLDIDDIAVGIKYYKSLEIFLGSDDQAQSEFIKKHLGDTDTPYYRGLAYFVLKGIKLWKWPNKGVPVMRAVILRNIAEYSADEYDPFHFTSTSALSIKSIKFFDGKIFATGHNHLAGYVDLNDGSWNVIDSIGFTVPFQNGLAVMNDTLYGISSTGLHEYNNDTTWTQLATFDGRCIANSVDEDLILFGNATVLNSEMQTYDGVSFSSKGNLISGTNPIACRIAESSTPLKALSALINQRYIFTYVPGCDLTTSWCSTGTSQFDSGPVNFIYVGTGDQNGWLTRTTSGGSSAELTVDNFQGAQITTYMNEITVGGTPLRCYSIEYFKGKVHIGVWNSGIDGGYMYSLDIPTEIFTKLDRPSGVPTDTSVRINCSTVHDGSLFVGSNKGIWRQ